MDENNGDDTAVTDPLQKFECTEEKEQNIHEQEASQNDNRNIDNKRGYFTIFSDFILPLFSIITYLLDVGSDIWLAASYAQAGHWWWFGWTTSFVVITGLLMAIAGWGHLNDEDDDLLYIANPVLRVFVTIVVMFSLTGPVLGWVYYQPH